MVVNHNGMIYSISDQNVLGEFVVAKINGKTKQVMSAKIVKAKTKLQVKKRIKSNLYDNFKELAINSIQDENNIVQ